MTSKVYIPSDGGHDYTDAERFGSLIICTEGSLDKFDLAQMYREMSDALYDSQPEDYILLTSLASLCSVASAIFALKHGQLHLLLYKGGVYVPRHLYLLQGNNTSERNTAYSER